VDKTQLNDIRERMRRLVLLTPSYSETAELVRVVANDTAAMLDEIERLRDALMNEAHAHTGRIREAADLGITLAAAEARERVLVEALERFAWPHNWTMEGEQYAWYRPENPVEIATAALSGGKQNLAE
jgi:hypothetical protein